MVLIALPVRQALAKTVTYKDTDNKKELDNPGTTYVIQGDGKSHKGDNHFTVPSDSSSEGHPIRITLKNVNVSQDGQDPSYAFITIEEGNYVIISLEGTNTITGGENVQVGDNNGMAAINVDEDSTLKVTSASGDGSTNGKLVAKGGGSKYGGAAIGSNYYYPMGNLIIAGGTIEATAPIAPQASAEGATARWETSPSPAARLPPEAVSMVLASAQATITALATAATFLASPYRGAKLRHMAAKTVLASAVARAATSVATCSLAVAP